MNGGHEEDFDGKDVYMRDGAEEISRYENVAASDPPFSLDYSLTPFPEKPPQLGNDYWSDAKGQPVNLTRGGFGKRFKLCLEILGISDTLPVEMMDELFRTAVDDCQQLSAWASFQKRLDSAEFKNSFEFIQQERERIEHVSSLLQRQQGAVVPREFLEWDGVWFGKLGELVTLIKKQLHSQESTMVFEKATWLTTRRTRLDTHLLLSALSSIEKLLKRKKIRLRAIAVLVAYAYAAKYSKIKTNGDPVEAMKVRISEAKKSKNKNAMETLILFQHFRPSQSKKS